jgi:hypothetical protein
MLGSNDKMPLPAIAAGQAGIVVRRNGNSSRLQRQHLASRRAGPQQPIAKKAKAGIHVRFQPVIRCAGIVVNLAAFTSACPLFVAALRGACPSHQIPPAMPKRNSGTGFFAAEMKEYDA